MLVETRLWRGRPELSKTRNCMRGGDDVRGGCRASVDCALMYGWMANGVDATLGNVRPAVDDGAESCRRAARTTAALTADVCGEAKLKSWRSVYGLACTAPCAL